MKSEILGNIWWEESNPKKELVNEAQKELMGFMKKYQIQKIDICWAKIFKGGK